MNPYILFAIEQSGGCALESTGEDPFQAMLA